MIRAGITKMRRRHTLLHTKQLSNGTLCNLKRSGVCGLENKLLVLCPRVGPGPDGARQKTVHVGG